MAENAEKEVLCARIFYFFWQGCVNKRAKACGGYQPGWEKCVLKKVLFENQAIVHTPTLDWLSNSQQTFHT